MRSDLLEWAEKRPRGAANTRGHGRPLQGGIDVAKPTLERRLWPRIDRQADGCWLWIGGRDSQGYGEIWTGEAMRRVHQIVYELLVGLVPAGLQLDHLCRVRHCCRPDHLEPVTRRENIARGKGFTAINGRKVACHAGHPFEGANLYITPDGKRSCRECRRQRMRRWRARK